MQPTMITAYDIAAFERILGPGALVTPPADLGAYELAARYGGGQAAAVLRPETTEQVSALVAHCVRRGLAFVPQSGNTGLVLGSTPDESGEQLVLSLERMRSPLKIDVADRTARVGAGVRLSTLNAALEPFDLFLPIDLGADPMLGGMAATNTGGARFLRYGDMRRHVLGLQVVMADRDGTVLQLSDGLRKDNSRLDLTSLFVGSCGALGVITEVVVEVHPRPDEVATALLVPRDEAAVMELLAIFERDAGPSLTAFEGMSKAAMTRALAHVLTLRAPHINGALPDYAILVEVSRAGKLGMSPGQVLEDILSSVVEIEGGPLSDAVLGAPERLWALRHSLSEGLRAAGAVIGFDLSFPRSKVMAFRRVACARLAAAFPEFEVCDFGHVADGGLHFNLLHAGGPPDPDRLAALGDLVLNLAVGDFGGSFSGEHGLGRANQEAYARWIAPDLRRLARDLADRLAPGAYGPVHL